MTNFQKLNLDSFFTELIKKIPEIKSIYEEHIKFNGEPLNYLLMFECVNFLIEIYRQYKKNPNNKNPYNVAVKICDFLKKAFESSADYQVKELITIEIAERLACSRSKIADVYEEIKLLLGPKLREEIKHYE